MAKSPYCAVKVPVDSLGVSEMGQGKFPEKTSWFA